VNLTEVGSICAQEGEYAFFKRQQLLGVLPEWGQEKDTPRTPHTKITGPAVKIRKREKMLEGRKLFLLKKHEERKRAAKEAQRKQLYSPICRCWVNKNSRVFIHHQE